MENQTTGGSPSRSASCCPLPSQPGYIAHMRERNRRELQRLLGHTSIETTEIYLHCLPSHTDRIGSPLDVESIPTSPHILRFPKSA